MAFTVCVSKGPFGPDKAIFSLFGSSSEIFCVHNNLWWLCFGLCFWFGLWFGVCLVVVVVVENVFQHCGGLFWIVCYVGKLWENICALGIAARNGFGSISTVA